MRKSIMALALVAMMTSPANAEPVNEPVHKAQRMYLCVYEDGSGGPLPCVWDGRHMGNGHGRSLVYFTCPHRPHHRCGNFVTHRRAHRLMMQAAPRSAS